MAGKSLSRKRSRRSHHSRSRSKVRIPVGEGTLPNYYVHDSTKHRRSVLAKMLSSKKATYSELIKRLNILVIFNKNRHPDISRKVKSDITYIQKNFKHYSLSQKRRSRSLRSRRRSSSRKSRKSRKSRRSRI